MTTEFSATPEGVMEKPRSIASLLEQMTPEIHQRLKTAVELGKWESGERLTPQQSELCLQAIIAWEQRHLPEDERVGYIEQAHCK